MPFILVFAAGGIAGFTLAGGTDDIAKVVKWAAIGGGVFIVAKQLKVI